MCTFCGRASAIFSFFSFFFFFNRFSSFYSGLAADWLSGTLYWTDVTYSRVHAVTDSGSHVRCIACWGVDQPRDIAVHPIKRFDEFLANFTGGFCSRFY
jgi:hypothetical protein